jgi:hypothetical protein
VARAALIVAIVSALLSAGALLQSVLSFRRSGWNLTVDAWWDDLYNQVHVEITNVGRQACVISEIRYFISDRTNSPDMMFGETVFFDNDAAPEPIAPSAKIEITKSFKGLPAAFTLEAWAWTGGRPYKSQKWIEDRWPVDGKLMRPTAPPAEL